MRGCVKASFFLLLRPLFLLSDLGYYHFYDCQQARDYWRARATSLYSIFSCSLSLPKSTIGFFLSRMGDSIVLWPSAGLSVYPSIPRKLSIGGVLWRTEIVQGTTDVVSMCMIYVFCVFTGLQVYAIYLLVCYVSC